VIADAFNLVLIGCVIAITAWIILGTGLPASGRHHQPRRRGSSTRTQPEDLA
jgi:hypothetical protein